MDGLSRRGSCALEKGRALGGHGCCRDGGGGMKKNRPSSVSGQHRVYPNNPRARHEVYPSRSSDTESAVALASRVVAIDVGIER